MIFLKQAMLRKMLPQMGEAYGSVEGKKLEKDVAKRPASSLGQNVDR
jgi:hypothetical protein